MIRRPILTRSSPWPGRLRALGPLAGLLAGLLTGLLTLVAPAAAQPGPQATGADVPAWFEEHLAGLTARGGTWTTSNEAYQSADEPYDAYRMVWTREVDAPVIRGVMTGLTGDRESAPLWTFQVFWHPGEGAARIQQWTDGGLMGEGTLERQPDGSEVAIQTFHAPGRPPFRLRHLSQLTDDVHITASSQPTEDGGWAEQRRYRWRR